MNKLDTSLKELRQLDELADLDSLCHRLSPLSKLLITLIYIILVISCGKYEPSPLILLTIYPFAAYSLAGISLRTCFYKLRFVLPLVCAVGIFNPLLDHSPFLYIGTAAVSRGWISFFTLMLKGVLCLCASFLLAATTRIDAVCCALRKLKVPSFIVSLLLLTFRYIGVMIDEASIMSSAYALRAPGQKGIAFKAWGSFLGQLLLRSMDRAEELYSAMKLRGFSNEFYYADMGSRTSSNTIITIITLIVLAALRSAGVLFT